MSDILVKLLRISVLPCALICISSCEKNEDINPQKPNVTTGERMGRIHYASRMSKEIFKTKVASNQRSSLILSEGQAVLPSWLSKEEMAVERQAAIGSSVQKSPLEKNHLPGLPQIADAYDDYRTTNIDKFFITNPPSVSVRPAAEYEMSQAYLMSWVSTLGTARDAILAEMVKKLWGSLPVIMIYTDDTHKTFIETQLKNVGIAESDLTDSTKIIWWNHKVNTPYVHEFGPVAVVGTSGTAGAGKISFVDFRYTRTRVYDDEIPSDLAKEWGVNVFRPDMDLEAGNFMATADGLCVSTKMVLDVNTQFAQSAIEEIYKTYLGCKKVLFLGYIRGDAVGHIHTIAKFASDTHVLLGQYTYEQDPVNRAILEDNANLLASTKNGSEAALTITRVPMPDAPIVSGSKIWRTYLNALAVNSGAQKRIFIPTYADDTTKEAEALAAFSAAFSGWTQVTLENKDFVTLGEGLNTFALPLIAGEKAKIQTDPSAKCGQQFYCTAPGCGPITEAGCCDGDILKICRSGRIIPLPCTYDPKCGWSAKNGYYDCGTTGDGEPTGTLPRNCGDQPAGCGNVTWEGCCDGETVWYCQDGHLNYDHCPTRNSPQCGWNSNKNYYSCGTEGQSEPSGTHLMSCNVFFGDSGAPKTDSGKPADASSVGCGEISEKGCCDGETLKFCIKNGDEEVIQSINCMPDNPSCGWSSNSNAYDCGTRGGADPAGKYRKACYASIVPDAGIKDMSKMDFFPADLFMKQDITIANPDTNAKRDAPIIVDQYPVQADQSFNTDGTVDTLSSDDVQTTVKETGVSKKDGSKNDIGTTTNGGDGCSCNVTSSSVTHRFDSVFLFLGLALTVLFRRRRRG